MDKQANKGFTLLEVVIVLWILITFFLISLPYAIRIEFNYFNPLVKQLEAMSKRKTVNFTDTISFNKNGNINKATTIKIENYSCVFWLGMGRYKCEKQG